MAIEATILAVPETAGSALYGMVDVLSATGTAWSQLTGEGPGEALVRPVIVAPGTKPFTCGNGIPVTPARSIADDSARGGIVILPELWLAPDDGLQDRYDAVKQWIRDRYSRGATIYTACSGSVLLAATGLLDGREATSHWGYADLFRTCYPSVRFRPDPNLVISDGSGRIVTAGGTTSWHDLAVHIVSRHCSPGEALRIAKVYLLKWHGEGQLPYASLVRRQSHADSAIRRAEQWLRNHYTDEAALSGAVHAAGLPERTLKRRFKSATGRTLIHEVQNLRIEEAKRLLESDGTAVEDVAALVGYDNTAFFRRLFKRSTGLNPGDYRRLFRPLSGVAEMTAQSVPSSP